MSNLIKVKDIYVDDDWNCRGWFKLSDVKELADSIQTEGQLQEVVVTPHNGEKPYRLIAGFRRFAAISRILGWEEIRANIVEADEEQARLMNLMENLKRDNLNPLQEALALEAVYPESQFSCREVEARIGKSTTWILQRRKLLKLDHDIQMKFASGRISISRVHDVANAIDRKEAAERLAQSSKAVIDSKKPRRKTMREINVMIRKLMELGLEGLPTQLLAWANGFISDQDIEYRIQQYTNDKRD